METLLWPEQHRTTRDARDAPGDALVGYSSGASTDDDGLPHTPPDLPFLAPALKAASSSQASSRASSRSRPPSTVLEIALAESSLAPFSHRDFSRSPSPPPSPQLSSSARQSRHRSLPAGFEHIPWISDDDDSDVEGRLSRSLSPPLHDLLSLPPLSPDVDDRDERDDEAKLDGDAAALSPSSATSDLPPSPPRTPSPRRRFASLSGAAAEHDLPWATSPERAPSSPDRSRSSPSPRRRSSTRSGLPTLRSQLSPPPPSPPTASSPASRSALSSSSPDKPVRPTLLRESSTTSTATSRRPALPISQAPSPPPSPRSRAALQLPTPDDVRARHAATRSGERGRARAAKREDGAATGAGAGDGLQLSFPSAAVAEAHEHEGEQKPQDGVGAAHGPAAHGPVVEDDSAAPVDEADPHSLDYFERHCHSLSLLRLRHALSVATVLASLPPSAPPSPPSSSSESEPSHSRSSASGTRREPLVAHVPGLSSAAAGAACASSMPAVGRPPSSRPSSSSTPLGAGPGDRSMVSQQYRLYAMGRAKAQRTGGVGYWEGGLAAWELLLMD